MDGVAGARILLVDDDQSVRRMLEAFLRSLGCCVSAVPSAEAALELLPNDQFEVLITDLVMDGLDGFALVRSVRQIDPYLPCILITGAATLMTVLNALNDGFHTCLLKPLQLEQLEQRVVAALNHRRERLQHQQVLRQLGTHLLRLAEPTGERYAVAAVGTPPLQIGPLRLDVKRYRVTVNHVVLDLSHGDFELLLFLARHTNQVVSVEEIAREVLHCASCSLFEARDLVKARIHRLRRKLAIVPEAEALLVSVRGAGYMLSYGD
ncbi:MAG: response regulator transcription factor [Oscillochloridaceae bacterium umkhey_bin13]